MTLNKKIYIKSYGCQMNVYDSHKMVDLLKPHGYSVVSESSDADVVILNTCHIREKAEQKVFSDIGRLRQQQEVRNANGQEMTILVGGCVGQAEGEEIIKQAPAVSMVFGTQNYHRLPEMLAKLNDNKRIVNTDFPADLKFDVLPLAESSPVSAFLSIQEGCDKFCTFCCVPYTRGSEYSRSVEKIIIEAKHLVSLGVKEITLLGQNVNAFHGVGLDGKEKNLGDLLFILAEAVPDLKRLRYTTSHPRDMHPTLIKAHAEIPMVMPFLHLPVQSGSNQILKAMNRKHDVDEYLQIIDQLRAARSDIAFSSDFIVGFPGETDADHHDTIKLVEAVNFSQAYSFKYSPRPGTPASVLNLQIPEEVKSERLQELQAAINKCQLLFNQSKVGTTQSVLFDRQGKIEEQILGKTSYMQSVHINNPEYSLLNQIIDVKITHGFANGLTGVVV